MYMYVYVYVCILNLCVYIYVYENVLRWLLCHSRLNLVLVVYIINYIYGLNNISCIFLVQYDQV